MILDILNNPKYLFPLCGAFVGGYKGYAIALERKQLRWGKYAHMLYPNIIPIGVFTGLGLSIGYCFSKLFEHG